MCLLRARSGWYLLRMRSFFKLHVSSERALTKAYGRLERLFLVPACSKRCQLVHWYLRWVTTSRFAYDTPHGTTREPVRHQRCVNVWFTLSCASLMLGGSGGVDVCYPFRGFPWCSARTCRQSESQMSTARPRAELRLPEDARTLEGHPEPESKLEWMEPQAWKWDQRTTSRTLFRERASNPAFCNHVPKS